MREIRTPRLTQFPSYQNTLTHPQGIRNSNHDNESDKTPCARRARCARPTVPCPRAFQPAHSLANNHQECSPTSVAPTRPVPTYFPSAHRPNFAGTHPTHSPRPPAGWRPLCTGTTSAASRLRVFYVTIHDACAAPYWVGSKTLSPLALKPHPCSRTAARSA